MNKEKIDDMDYYEKYLLNATKEELQKALDEERRKNNVHEETIRILQEQLDDLIETLEVAKAA